MKNSTTQFAALLLSTLSLLTGAYGQTGASPSTESLPESSLEKRLTQTPARRTPGVSRRSAPLGERQSGLPHASPAAAVHDSSSSFTYTFGLVDFPLSTNGAAFGINDRGEIVGGYNDVNLLDYPAEYAFELKKNAFSSIAFPGAVQTAAYGINKKGEIVGMFVDSSGGLHGFTLVDKTYTQLDCPGVTGFTVALTINNHGEIVGVCGSSGFLLSGGVYTTINVPGAPVTWAEGINTAGVIVGYYVGSSDNYDGFMYSGGTFTTIDYPGYPNTYLAGINDSGLIVGAYGSDTMIGSTTYPWTNGFVYSAGTFSSFDVPFGAVAATEPYTLNNNGEIVGGYVDSTGMTYGFYAKVTQ
jgi:hypothetical protein